jgi:hypothetical protein
MHPKAIQATVKQVTDKSVALSIEGTSVNWPASKLSGVKQGDVVNLVAFTHKNFESERNEVAKALLNEVMKGGSDED